MSGDLVQEVAGMVPYITPALSAYGGAVLAKAQDDAAEATVGFGRRILQRIFGRRKEGEPLPSALAGVVAHPGDDDYTAGLRIAVREALADDSQMLAEVREIVKEAKAAVSAGSQSAQADRAGIATNVTAGGNVTTTSTTNATNSNNTNSNNSNSNNTTNTNTGNTYNSKFTAGRDIHHSDGDMTITRAD